MNIGVDFGSTNTAISVYRNNRPEAMVDVLSPNIPSLVNISGTGKAFYGQTAKKQIGKPGSTTFKAFKMLLPEQREKILRERGYTKEHSPVSVAEGFLKYCISKALNKFEQSRFDNLVICAPEIWGADINTVDGRTILRDICAKHKDIIGNVQVVSEPSAASAFFAHNYRQLTGKTYEGHILLVDYGGGTLDITLTKVTTALDKQGNQTMEIKVLERTGAGENEDRCVGKAGVAYMEAVVRKTLVKSKVFKTEKDVPSDSTFFKTANDLEDEMISQSEDVIAVFQEYGKNGKFDKKGLEEEEFMELYYGEQPITVNFGTMLQCYEEIISPVLENRIAYMQKFMDQNGIRYMDPNAEDFKIAVVGGFGVYHLVGEEVRRIFQFSTLDKRDKHIIKTAQDRQLAVSYGAALIAEGKVVIRSTAPYSIGLYAEVGQELVANTNFSINVRQEIEYNKPYYQCDKSGRRIPFIVLPQGNVIEKFIINATRDVKDAVVVKLKPDLVQRIQSMRIKNQDRPFYTAHIAFSLDQSEVLSFHVFILDRDYQEDPNGHYKIELTRFNDMMELTEAVPLIPRGRK